MDTHGKYGGVVPELASRDDLRAIVPAVREVLGDFANQAGREARRAEAPVEYAALALVVTGGHTHLFEVQAGFGYRLLGKTATLSAKPSTKWPSCSVSATPAARLSTVAPHGNPSAVRFTFARMKGNPLDFSSSGLKTAALRWVEAHDVAAEIAARRALLRASPRPSGSDWLAVTPQPTLDPLALFQHAVIHELLTRAAASAETIGARTLIVSGGVACNSGLRKAAAAFPKLARREFAGLDIAAQAALRLAQPSNWRGRLVRGRLFGVLDVQHLHRAFGFR